MKTATLGAGCFWCVEAAFLSLKGVIKVMPGYSGGHKPDPTYEEVCTGNTGHAEVCHIEYDETHLSYTQILEAFFQVHDPTSINKQGEDIGSQYRSVIFHHSANQKQLALEAIDKLNKSNIYAKDIVTEIEEFVTFYHAEDYHKNYFENNPKNPYCARVVKPKVEKFRTVFASLQK